MQPTVLLFGSDSQLLSTRQWILERCGCQVSIALLLPEAEQILHSCHVDLLILCHSAFAEDFARLLEISMRRFPKLKVLTLTAGLRGYRAPTLSDTYDTGDGPEKFALKVKQMLSLEGNLQPGTQPLQEALRFSGPATKRSRPAEAYQPSALRRAV